MYLTSELLNKNLKVCVLLFAVLMLSQTGCKKLVEVDTPITSTNADNVYATDATAIAVLTGIYTNIGTSSFGGGGILSLSFFPGLSADELTLFSGSLNNNSVEAYYTNSLTNNNLNSPDFWTAFYKTIFVCNAAIKGLTDAKGLTSAVKQQLLGESKFMRAFCYFYLVNLYGDVPVTTTVDYKVNALLSRTSQMQVYQQIKADLSDAQELLSADYLDGTLLNSTADRLRPTKWAAIALLARVDLYYNHDWANAESNATAVIDNATQYSLSSLENAFLMNNTEAIWQLQPVNIDINTPEAWLFILPDTGPDLIHPVYLSPQLLSSFENGDKRKENWINTVTVGNNTYYYSYKYKSATLGAPVTEFSTVLRLAEQYLIRAEARVQLGNISGAAADLNMIRSRAGLPNTTAATRDDLLTAILQERQVELFTEWGHRWLDMKRTNTIDNTMTAVTPQKGGIWRPQWQWYPIPLSELKYDPNLVQNEGY